MVLKQWETKATPAVQSKYICRECLNQTGPPCDSEAGAAGLWEQMHLDCRGLSCNEEARCIDDVRALACDRDSDSCVVLEQRHRLCVEQDQIHHAAAASLRPRPRQALPPRPRRAVVCARVPCGGTRLREASRQNGLLLERGELGLELRVRRGRRHRWAERRNLEIGSVRRHFAVDLSDKVFLQAAIGVMS